MSVQLLREKEVRDLERVGSQACRRAGSLGAGVPAREKALQSCQKQGSLQEVGDSEKGKPVWLEHPERERVGGEFRGEVTGRHPRAPWASAERVSGGAGPQRGWGAVVGSMVWKDTPPQAPT